MKINYVLLYGCPYLQHREFETFDDISKFIVKKGITNYNIYELMDDKKEVEMILLNSDIQVLEKRINKAIEYIDTLYINEYDGNSYYIKDNTGNDELGIEDIPNNIKNILKDEDNKEIPQFEGTLEQLDKLSIRGEDEGNTKE